MLQEEMNGGNTNLQVMETSDHSAYLKTIEKKLNGILKKAPEKFEGEDYHHLRVEVKKLNALADSIKFCSSRFNKDRGFKTLKKIFKHAGKIRELQLEERMLQENHSQSIDEYLSGLDDRIKKEQKRFSAALGKKSVRKIKKIFRAVEPYIHNMSDAEIAEFIKAERNKIRELTEERPLKPANVHQIRKLLKVDFYNRKRLPLPDGQLIKEEDLFLELLGKWHDCRTLNNQLGTSILQGKVSPFELSNLLQINDAVSLNAENLFKEIKASLERGIY